MAADLAVVTGGTSGLGLALAEGLVERGVSVGVIGRDPDRVEAAVRRLRDLGGDATGRSCDVADEPGVRAAFEAFRSTGPIRWLFNVAGVGRFGPPRSITAPMIDEVLGGNLKGLMITTATALPAMEQAGGGTVISVLSTAALVGRANEAVYCAAKWGARGFMEALRAAVKGSTIRTMTVYPGGMRTAFWSPEAGMSPDLDAYMDPRDVAERILRVALEAEGPQVSEITISRS